MRAFCARRKAVNISDTSEFNNDRSHRPRVNVSTNESERKRPANHNANHFTTQRARGTCRALMVVQCDQTSFLATSMMLLSEEARRPFQRPVQLPLTDEVQHGDRIDCSRSAVLARRRRLGILSLARLPQSQDERVNMLLDGIHALQEGRSTPDAGARALFRFPELSQPTWGVLSLGSQESWVLMHKNAI